MNPIVGEEAANNTAYETNLRYFLIIGVPLFPNEEEIRQQQFLYFKNHSKHLYDECEYVSCHSFQTVIESINQRPLIAQIYILSHSDDEGRLVFNDGNVYPVQAILDSIDSRRHCCIHTFAHPKITHHDSPSHSILGYIAHLGSTLGGRHSNVPAPYNIPIKDVYGGIIGWAHSGLNPEVLMNLS